MNWEKSEPLIIAHRGASSEAPENSMAAFQLAVERHCDMIELDIHMTHDGQLVVSHDESVERTTNGTGLIREMEAAEISELDAGSWFNPIYADERIPHLSEVFRQIPASIGLNIEIKTVHPSLEARLLALIHEYERVDGVVLSSFDHKLLYRLKKQVPSVRVGLIYWAKLLNPLKVANDFDLGIFSMHPQFQLLDREDIAALRANGQHTYVWTVNQLSDMQQMIEYGVSGIMTDQVASLYEQLQAVTR